MMALPTRALSVAQESARLAGARLGMGCLHNHNFP